MAQKITNDEGVEIEVFTADEVKNQTDAAIAAKEAEFGKTRAQIEAERDEARTALGERTAEFGNFRKLREEDLKKLSVAEQTIYRNQEALQKANEDKAASEKKIVDSMVDNAIRTKAGADDKLFARMKEMWGVIGIDAVTPEQIEIKSKMVLGAIGLSQPDLVASVAGFNGGYMPPQQQKSGEGSFADTERGKSGAAELGLKF